MAGMDIAKAESRVESVEKDIAASPEQIFEILTDIHQHPALDGSGMLQGEPQGPDRLELGSRFSLAMKQVGPAYRSANKVVEFEEGRRIAWRTAGEWRGRQVVGGQVWRWELTPIDGGRTRVKHSYVWGYASGALMLKVGGYPSRMRVAIGKTVDNLAREVTGA